MLPNITTVALLSTSAAGDCTIDSDGYVVITGLKKFKKTNLVSYSVTPSQLEVVQLASILMPTILAATPYEFLINILTELEVSNQSPAKKIRYNSPTSLSGTANTDKINAATAMAAAINNNAWYYAQVRASVTNVADETARTITGATWSGGIATFTATNTFVPGQQVVVASVVASVGNFNGTYTVLTSNGTTWTAAKAATATYTSGGTATSTGIQLILTDQPGYYPARPSNRTGATYIGLGINFPSNALTIGTTALYDIGVGTRMLRDKTFIDPIYGNMPLGEWLYPNVNNLPISGITAIAGQADPVQGQLYGTLTIVYTDPQIGPGVQESNQRINKMQILYIDNGLGTITTNAAGYTAFIAKVNQNTAGGGLALP